MNTFTATTIRVIEIMITDFGLRSYGILSEITETVKWLGTDINELSRLYPPSKVFGADPLGRSEIEDGLIRYSYRFERQSEDGSWVAIDDPRRRLTPMSEFECAVDAENRRDFPGDFLDVCQDCGRDPCECDDDRIDDYVDPPEYCADCGEEIVHDEIDHDRLLCAICKRCPAACFCD